MVESRINNHAAFIWSVADLLRGDYKQSEYGKVILPLTVLRRLDCVLEPTKAAVLAPVARLPGKARSVAQLAPTRSTCSSSAAFTRSPLSASLGSCGCDSGSIRGYRGR